MIMSENKKKEYLKEYYEKNKDEIKEKMREKVECECGGEYTRYNKGFCEKTNMTNIFYINIKYISN
jgi:hypothetical protein